MEVNEYECLHAYDYDGFMVKKGQIVDGSINNKGLVILLCTGWFQVESKWFRKKIVS